MICVIRIGALAAVDFFPCSVKCVIGQHRYWWITLDRRSTVERCCYFWSMVLDILTKWVSISNDLVIKFGHHSHRLHEALSVPPCEHNEAWTTSDWNWNVGRRMWWLAVRVHTLNNVVFLRQTGKTRKGRWLSLSWCGPISTRAAGRRERQGWLHWYRS